MKNLTKILGTTIIAIGFAATSNIALAGNYGKHKNHGKHVQKHQWNKHHKQHRNHKKFKHVQRHHKIKLGDTKGDHNNRWGGGRHVNKHNKGLNRSHQNQRHQVTQREEIGFYEGWPAKQQHKFKHVEVKHNQHKNHNRFRNQKRNGEPFHYTKVKWVYKGGQKRAICKKDYYPTRNKGKSVCAPVKFKKVHNIKGASTSFTATDDLWK